jgi:hypothetical protein
MSIPRFVGGAPPIPPEDATRPHGYTPPESSSALPPSQPKAKGKGDKPEAEQDLWTFSYVGTSGDEGAVATFPVIELPKPKPITIQFYADTALRGSVRMAPQPDQTTMIAYHNYDDPQVIADPGDGKFRVVATGGGDSAILIGTSSVPIEVVEGVTHYGPVEDNPSLLTATKIYFQDSSEGSRKYTYDILDVDTSDPEFVRFNVGPATETAGTPLADNDLCYIGLLTPVADVPVQPNAGVRARITYSAGSSGDVQFDCDWSGALQLMASRVTLQRVTVPTDGELPFEPQPVKVAAIALVNGARPVALPTLTELTQLVAEDETITLVVPGLARRLSLIAIYGNEGAPGDIPLGEIFVAFVSAGDNAIAYIDAMSAREALFGQGLPIPAGTRAVALSNRSDDPSMRLGAVWHLGA